ncbi:MAG TPA: flagellar biosynthetic protein FliO [Polyangiaceae bacterium]|nr:flagellar biosynthetic protein FliO [Polyangiaceae bacterium]
MKNLVSALAFSALTLLPNFALADGPPLPPEQKPWLAHHGEIAMPEENSSGAPMVRSLAATAVLAGLGGAALFLKKRRRKPAVLASDFAIDVLGTTRIGPKALAVVAHVGGRTILLGVTDGSVSRLAWLDEQSAGDDEERESDENGALAVPGAKAMTLPRRNPAVHRTETKMEPAPAAPAFKDVLARWNRAEPKAKKARAEAESPAVVVAEATRDVFSRKDRVLGTSDRAIEGQARGLAARLQSRVV